jgi:hypothetical protein
MYLGFCIILISKTTSSSLLFSCMCAFFSPSFLDKILEFIVHSGILLIDNEERTKLLESFNCVLFPKGKLTTFLFLARIVYLFIIFVSAIILLTRIQQSLFVFLTFYFCLFVIIVIQIIRRRTKRPYLAIA